MVLVNRREQFLCTIAIYYLCFFFCLYDCLVCATREASDFLSNNPANDSSQPAIATTTQPRRALIIAEAAGLSLQQQLTASGYLTRAAAIADAPRAIEEFKPDVILMVVVHAGGDSENENVALARKLRAETATSSALSLVE